MPFNPELQRQIEQDRFALDDEPDPDPGTTLEDLETRLINVQSGVQGTQALLILLALLLAGLVIWR